MVSRTKVLVSRMVRKLNLQAVSSLYAVQFSEIRCIFVFAFAQQNSRASFSRMADHSYNVAKSLGNLSKFESPEMVLNTTQWGLFGFLFFVFAFSFLYNESVIIFKITYEASSFRVSAIQSSSCYVILETKGSATTGVCWWNILGFGG